MNDSPLVAVLIYLLLILGGLAAAGVIFALLAFALPLFFMIFAGPGDPLSTFVRWVGPALAYLVLYGVALARGIRYARDRARLSDTAVTLDVIVVAIPVLSLLLEPILYGPTPARDGPPPSAVARPAATPPAATRSPPAPSAPAVPAPSQAATGARFSTLEMENREFARRDLLQACIRDTFSQWQQQQSMPPGIETESAKIRAIRSDCEAKFPKQ
jgi:hypothetical protein